jgi:hypothetical protein
MTSMLLLELFQLAGTVKDVPAVRIIVTVVRAAFAPPSSARGVAAKGNEPSIYVIL